MVSDTGCATHCPVSDMLHARTGIVLGADAQVEPAVQSIGVFPDAGEVDSIMEVLERWQRVMRTDSSMALLATEAPPTGKGINPDDLLPPRRRWHEPRVPLWRALAILIPLFSQPALEHVLTSLPEFADTVVSHSLQVSGHRCALTTMRSFIIIEIAFKLRSPA